MRDWNKAQMTFHLIRHGRTEANEKRLYCGSTDISLSGNGVRELLALKKQIRYPAAELYIVSGLLRTVQTADILFDSPALTEVEPLREISFGDFEMHGYEELKLNPAYQSWISDIERLCPPGGESKPEFTKRVMQGFFETESICKANAVNSAIIITHGGVIATIMEFFYPGQINFYEWQPACGRGYTLTFENTCNIGYTKI